MWVEAGHQDARPGNRKLAAQVGVEDAQRFDERLAGDCAGDLREREVRGRQSHAHAAADDLAAGWSGQSELLR